MSDVDPTAVMSAHQDHVGGDDSQCVARHFAEIATEVEWDEHCDAYLLAEALAASEARPVVVRSVVRGSRPYWLIDGLLEADAIWVTRQLPDPG